MTIQSKEAIQAELRANAARLKQVHEAAAKQAALQQSATEVITAPAPTTGLARPS